MTSLISLLIIVTLSILATRVATVALTLTGLSRDMARFQALSAFTGVGFTTEEAEAVVNHPARRRIIMIVMRLGNVGVITAISSLLLTFVDTAESSERLIRFVWLAAGLGVLWYLATSGRVDHYLSAVIRQALRHWTDLDARDYASLLNIPNGYRIAEMHVEEGDWIAKQTLAETQLSAEGIIILGIRRAREDYIGAPQGDTYISPGDTLLLYGRADSITELDQRLHGRAGDERHARAVEAQDEFVREQTARDSISARHRS